MTISTTVLLIWTVVVGVVLVSVALFCFFGRVSFQRKSPFSLFVCKAAELVARFVPSTPLAVYSMSNVHLVIMCAKFFSPCLDYVSFFMHASYSDLHFQSQLNHIAFQPCMFYVMFCSHSHVSNNNSLDCSSLESASRQSIAWQQRSTRAQPLVNMTVRQCTGVTGRQLSGN